MPIIVAGNIAVQPGQRGIFIQQSLAAIQAARQTEGCYDFAVSPDPLEADRVNIYEHWRSEQDLQAFRASGPDSDLSALIQSLYVREYPLAE
jgi:quinol monooxygenase YgiN